MKERRLHAACNFSLKTMLNLLLLACSAGMVASVGVKECTGMKDSFSYFLQGCNLCWCQHGKPTCTNLWCTSLNEGGDDEDDDETNSNAMGIQAWDLKRKFPKKDVTELNPVTAYPPSFHKKFNLVHPVLERGRLTEQAMDGVPDAGGLNVLIDREDDIEPGVYYPRNYANINRQFYPAFQPIPYYPSLPILQPVVKPFIIGA